MLVYMIGFFEDSPPIITTLDADKAELYVDRLIEFAKGYVELVPEIKTRKEYLEKIEETDTEEYQGISELYPLIVKFEKFTKPYIKIVRTDIPDDTTGLPEVMAKYTGATW